MIIVIDGYNLLRTVPPYKKTITDTERKQFIAQLGRYGRAKGHKIVVVFDGGPYEWPIKEKQSNNVLLIYSGIHESADDCIRHYLEMHRTQDIVLVTSDRELNNYAAQFSITSIDSYAFYHLLLQAKKQAPTKSANNSVVVKTTSELNNDSIDELMLQASQMVAEKSEDIDSQMKKGRVPKKQQETKEEKKLLKKLRKL